MGFHVEVCFSGFPFVADLAEDGGGQPQQGRFVGEECGDAGSSFELLVESFLAVGRSQAFAVFGGEGEDRQAFGDVVFEPVGQTRGGVAVLFDETGEAAWAMSSSMSCSSVVESSWAFRGWVIGGSLGCE